MEAALSSETLIFYHITTALKIKATWFWEALVSYQIAALLKTEAGLSLESFLSYNFAKRQIFSSIFYCILYVAVNDREMAQCMQVCCQVSK